MCFGEIIQTELSQSNSNIINQEISLLLELHKNYCGEDFLCKNYSSYWKPSEERMPMPCCVPCSCLPTCEDQDCCPAFWKNKTVEDLRLGNTGAMQNEQRSNQSDIIDDDKLHEEDNPNEIIENKTSSSLTNITSCVRPQALYGLNRVLYSDAYEMVNTCPEWFMDVATIEKCHSGMDNGNVIDIIPITSTLNGLTYANKYCSECNGIYANTTSKFYDWQPALVGFGKNLPHRSILHPEFIIQHIDVFKTGFENIHFIPERVASPVRCKTYDIAVCNQTGLLDIYNETMEKICLKGPGLPIMQKIGSKRVLFKILLVFIAIWTKI